MLFQTAAAQTKTVTGTVVDASTNSPMPGVNVVVKGTSMGAITAMNGAYTISGVSPGQTLVFTFIGYTTKEILVGTQDRYDVTLSSAAVEVAEVVVTGEFGMKRVARAVGSSVQTVKAADIQESGRDNFITALQGRVAGLNVSTTSGAPGASTTVVLRAITSISGNNQPLYVIDGVPMNNTTFNPLDQTTSSLEFYSVRNLDYSSRGNDLNPEDIESMTVLKGAAAAALYGSDASNGAIIITTKKGEAGKGKISYGNQFRWDQSYGFKDLLQNKYANGYYGTTNWYYQTRYGSEYPGDIPIYDNIGAIFQTGYTQRHNLSAEYGTEKVTLRGSVSTTDQTGTVKTTGLTRLNLTLSGTAQVNKWLKLESSMMYAGSTNDKVNTGTESPFYRASYWPIVSDATEYLQTDGKHMAYPDYYLDTDLLNPFFELYKNKFYDDADRMLTTMAANLTPVKNTFLRVQMGWDVGMQTFVTSRHPYYSTGQTGAGYYNLTKSNFSDPTLNILAGYSNNFFNDNLSVSAQFGYHQQENGVARVATTGSKFLDPNFQSIQNCDPLSISSVSRNSKRRIQALSGQLELGYKNMAYLTLRGRNDWSSTLPVENNRFFYPAVEASFILSELSFIKENVKPINYLKLRATFAQVGKDAGPLEIDPQLTVTALWGGGYRYDYTGPNPDLVPEMNTSKEIGFEGRFLNNRINADFTYFWTKCNDQIVKSFRMSYGTGFVLNTMNVGDFNTWGLEGHIDGDILRMANGLRVNIGFNAAHTGSEVTYLPPNLSEYYNAYTWNSGNIRNGIQVGQPITSLTGMAFQRNDNGDLLIDPTTGLPLTSSSWSVIGDREPKLRYGITTAVSYKNLRFSATFAGRYKATVINGTKRTMMQQGYSWESVDARESGPVVFNGVLKDGNENSASPTQNTMSVSYDLYSTIYSGGDENWVEKNVNYLRLQDIRLTYNLPNKWLSKTPLSQASIFATGNDLFIITNYSGIDAVGNTVSAAAGGTGGEGMDIWSLPMPRGYSVGINVTFK